jgi:hypothetical protein
MLNIYCACTNFANADHPLRNRKIVLFFRFVCTKAASNQPDNFRPYIAASGAAITVIQLFNKLSTVLAAWEPSSFWPSTVRGYPLTFQTNTVTLEKDEEKKSFSHLHRIWSNRRLCLLRRLYNCPSSSLSSRVGMSGPGCSSVVRGLFRPMNPLNQPE